MLNDGSLEKRLNAVKDGQEVPVPAINPSDYNWAPQIPQKVSLTQEIIIFTYKSVNKLLGVLLASFLYGLAFQAILIATSVIEPETWNMFQVLGLGFLFNHALTVFPLTFKKLFSRKSV